MDHWFWFVRDINSNICQPATHPTMHAVCLFAHICHLLLLLNKRISLCLQKHDKLCVSGCKFLSWKGRLYIVRCKSPVLHNSTVHKRHQVHEICEVHFPTGADTGRVASISSDMHDQFMGYFLRNNSYDVHGWMDNPLSRCGRPVVGGADTPYASGDG